MLSARIAVFPASELLHRQRLFGALTRLYSVEFVPGNARDVRRGESAAIFGTTREEALQLASRGVRVLAFIGDSERSARPAEGVVRFHSTPHVSSCFRGQTFPETAIRTLQRLEVDTGDELVASKGSDPLWTQRGDGITSTDFVADAPLELCDGEYLYQHFQWDNWVRLLPLLQFVREISGWQFGPPRATLMFDDPNIRWKSYGYIHYEQLLRHAQRHNHHACFATIPMDAWFVHQKTAALFRKNADRLSLLVHGNNHTHFELHTEVDEQEREGLALQALGRIDRMEQASRITVRRVMAAPHGACSHAMGTALVRAGFDAACISRSSLMACNPERAWPLDVGLKPAESLGEGLPVLPRFNIRWDPQSYIRLAAFLGQPIIPVGHHDDLAEGLNVLEERATLINSLGRIKWMDMAAMAESNYWTRQVGDALYARLFSRRVSLVVPEGVQQLYVDFPLADGAGDGLSGLLQVSSTESTVVSTCRAAEEPVSVMSGQSLTISAPHPQMIRAAAVTMPSTSLWAIVRRQLCEGRDRARPVFDRLRRVGAKAQG